MSAVTGYTATSLIPMVVNETVRITCSNQAAEIVRNLIGDQINEKEHFCLITLDGASHIIRAETIFIGTLNQSLVHPREVFKPAIVDGAAGIILSHNHPSGTLEASRADIQITNRLKEVGKLVGIEVLDHIVITGEGHYSFSEEGLL